MQKFEGYNLINGSFYRNDSMFSKIDPYTGIELGNFPCSTLETVNRAIVSAREAYPKWRRVSRIYRGELFQKLTRLVDRDKDRLANIMVRETGKTLNEAMAEVIEALHMAEFVAGSAKVPVGEILASELAEKTVSVIRKPKGVVGVISPFNFPAAIGGFWCAAPALLEGNTVVWKPSEDTPLIAQVVAELYQEAGFPAGVLNLVHGDGKTGEFLSRGEVDCILFTGSAIVGDKIKAVCAGDYRKSCACEMGSKSAVIVFDDANIELALDAAINSAFKLSGQRCVSASRIIIQGGIYQSFCDSFAERASKLVVGDPFNPETNYGPLINKQAIDKVCAYNDAIRKDDNCEVLLDPGLPFSAGEGLPSLMIRPMVFKSEWRPVDHLRSEIFGPTVALIPFDSVQDAIRIYNDTEYGLSVGVVTENIKTFNECLHGIDCGIYYWNGGSIAAESHVPFGGLKRSGNGFPSASRTYRAVTHEVAVTYNYGDSLQFPQGMK